jgi:tetratricopeptide (TPR) repeat protein
MRRLLALTGSNPAVRARALWGAYWLALHQLDHEEARSLCTELLELATSRQDQLGRRNALTGLGMASLFEGAYEEALPMFKEALELARAAGDRWILATSTFNLAHALVEVGRREEGDALLEEARRMYLAVGDSAFAARMLLYLARTSVVGGDIGKAGRLVLEATDAFSGLGEAWGQVECLEVGSAVLAGRGRDLAAAAALGAARVAHERLGTAQLPPDAALLAPILETASSRAGPAWGDSLAQGAQLPVRDAIAEMVDALISNP